MIKNVLLAAFIAIPFVIEAQTAITITSSDMPNENDFIHVSIVGSNDFINVPNPSTTGLAHTWDFSSLLPDIQQDERYNSPLDFTTPYNYLFNPFNTSYGRDNYEFSSIPLPNTDISAAYDFFKESSSQLKQIGAGFIINDQPLPFLYSQDDIVYEFPMTFLSTSTCNYKYGLEIPGTGYYGQSGTRTNLVDGWGTLTTPFGSFQTIRLKSTVDAVDTVYNNSLSAGANIPRPLKHEYKWLANGMKIPVLKIETNVIGGNETISNVRYIDSTRSDVPQVGIAENSSMYLKSSVYPNPCINELTFAYQLPAAAEVKIVLADVIGKIVYTLANEEQISGEHRRTISTAQLTPGIYLLTLQTGKYKEIQKVVVTK